MACLCLPVQDSVRGCAVADPSGANASTLQAAVLSHALTACAHLQHLPSSTQLGHICSILEAHGAALQVRGARICSGVPTAPWPVLCAWHIYRCQRSHRLFVCHKDAAMQPACPAFFGTARGACRQW